MSEILYMALIVYEIYFAFPIFLLKNGLLLLLATFQSKDIFDTFKSLALVVKSM